MITTAERETLYLQEQRIKPRRRRFVRRNPTMVGGMALLGLLCIMAEGRTSVRIAFWIVLFPGLCLAITVLASNLIGDGWRDTLDRKLARRM